jgi:hypothetical protein
MELDDFLIDLLAHLENTYNNGKNKNSEIQVGFCRTDSDIIIYISDNKANKPGYNELKFDGKNIGRYVYSNNQDLAKLNIKIKIVGRPQGFSGCLHAEMNIIRQMLNDLCEKKNFTQHTTLYLKGKKCPCKKCQDFIDLLNSVASHFLTVNVLRPTEEVSQRQNPSMWDNPMNYLAKDCILSILSESDYDILCSVKDIQ